MFNIRKAIKRFKVDFEEPDVVPSISSLRSDKSSSRTPSKDVSGYSAPLTRSLRNTTNRDELPTIPVGPADSSNFSEAVSPLQKRSLFQSLQHNPSLVPPSEPLPSIESGPSRQDQSKFLNSTPILGKPIPINPLEKEFSKIALSNSSEKRTSSSSDSSASWDEYIPLPATPSKKVLSESLQQNSFLKNLPPDPRPKGFETESALLTSQWQESKGAYYDTRPESPVDFSIPSNASSSKTTNGSTVSSTPLARKFRDFFSNSTSPSSSEVEGGPMESKQSSVTQTSQQSRESPYDDSVIQTTTPTVINNNDNVQSTLETKERLDPASITQTFPLTANKLLPRPDPFFKRENSVPGDFPPDGPSTPSFPIPLAVTSAAPTVSTQVSERVEQPKTPWRPKPSQLLQPIGESSDSNNPSALSPEDVLALKMEELGRIRRMEARNQLAQSKASHKMTPQRPSQPIRTTANPKAELRPHIHHSSDVTRLLAAYIERQQALQTQIDKALAELRDEQDENKRLTNENQSQHHSISQLKIAFYEVKHVQDPSSVQIENQLRDVLASLTALKKEQRGWRDEFDSMHHKLSAAERQVRCLDHLTRHKFESREEADQPKRRGLFPSVPASTGVIGAMGALNEEIFQTCVHFAGSLRRMNIHSNRHKSQAQKVVGDHLTAMMEDQAAMTTSGYNALLMQAVLEVFMVHWCSSIIQAFYPKQESFADLLVQLSARTSRTSGSSTICGKQIRIEQHITPHPDKVKFNEWVTDVIKELDFILMVAGVRMKTQHIQLFYTKTLALVKAVYDIRIAMAEQDIHGGLEVVIVPPDTPFEEKRMLDAHADPKKGDTDQPYVDVVAGTSGMGLQRKVLERVDGHFQSKMDAELKPKVMLAQVLKVKIQSSRVIS